jgi:general L-amino acid transport system permease protein
MSTGGRLPQEIETALRAAGEEPPVSSAPLKPPATPREWIMANLLSSWFNATLTLIAGGVLVVGGFLLFRWLFVSAQWDVLRANLRIYMVGRFPLEEMWRVWASAYFVMFLAGLSFGVSDYRLRWTARAAIVRVAILGLLVLALVSLLEGTSIWIRIAVFPVLLVAGVVLGRRGGRRLRLPLAVAWALAFPIVIMLLRGFDGVPPQEWGGFLLNVLLAIVGIFLSFPIGLLLALGRRSSLRIISTFCVGFIELIRGVPLVTLLFVGDILVPLMLPHGMDPARIVRAMAMITVFSSAYVAEIVRGGMQGVPAGQYEASRAIGLSTPRMMGLIILPQALRSTIPALISHFISLFKDTTLVAILGLSELLDIARRAPAQLEFLGTQREALVGAAVFFWVVAFAMSRWSQRLERRLGVGER